MTQSIAIERLWDVLFGLNGTLSPREFPLVASLCYYATTMLIARLLRTANTKLLPGTVHPYVADMITTFQVCACSLENIMIRNAYGFAAYGFTLFALGTWIAVTVTEGRGNPCANVISYMKGGQSLRMTFLRCCLQLFGGLLSYRYAQCFWYLEMTEGYGQRFHALHCMAGLSVPFLIGLGVEFAGTLFESFLCITTFTPFFLCETTSKALIGSLMTCAGVHLTGMYLNPVNAFNQEFLCHGVSGLEHIVIYWLGPLAAAATAVWLQRHLTELAKTIITKDPAVERKVRGSKSETQHRNAVSPKMRDDRQEPVKNGGSTSKTRQRKVAKKHAM